MFELGENFLRNALAFLLLAVGVVGLGLAIAEYVRQRNVAKSVGMLAGAIMLIVVGGSIFWIAGAISDDISPTIKQTVDPNKLVSNYEWGQQSGGGGGGGGAGGGG